MPGHKGSRLYREFGYDSFLDGFLDWDITEIPGADDLFEASGIIDGVQKRYAALFDVEKTYLMVNGTSGALIASILTCVPEGGKMIIGTNSHRAVLNGLSLAGAQPVFVAPEKLWDGDVEGATLPAADGCGGAEGDGAEPTGSMDRPFRSVKEAIDANPDAAAVLVTSPNYYGIVSDIEKIAQLTHDAGMILIVDQAHGAHLAFFEKYAGGSTGYVVTGDGAHVDGAPGDNTHSRLVPAEKLGADIVTCSVHKTLASMTQSAVLHICSSAPEGRIDTEVIEEKLKMIESSSPSYILMTSLEINADLIEKHGSELFRRWDRGLDLFYERAAGIPGLETLYGDIDDHIDRSKIVIRMRRGADGPDEPVGTDGPKGPDEDWIAAEDLEALLMEKGIFCEKKNGRALVCLSGIGNTTEDYTALADALEDIAIH